MRAFGQTDPITNVHFRQMMKEVLTLKRKIRLEIENTHGLGKHSD